MRRTAEAGPSWRIYGTTCSTDGGFFSQCFVKDGAVGTLSGSQVFVAMDSSASGTIFGLVDSAGSSYSNSTSGAKGYLLERIDIANRTVVSRRAVQAAIGAVVAFRDIPANGSAVLGYRNLSNGYYFPSDPYPGFTVSLFAY